jgi:hypothetical protein
MKAIEQRVMRLEQDAPAEARCYAWANVGETADEAIAREFPNGLPDDATVIVFRFAEPQDGDG